MKEGLEVKSEDGLTNHLRKIAKKKQHNWTINKDGIFADKSETIFHQAKGHWNNFCKLVYTDHEQPPTEEQVLDYMKLKKEAGRSSSMVVEYKKGLGRVCALFCSVLFFGFLKNFFQCSLISSTLRQLLKKISDYLFNSCLEVRKGKSNLALSK